MKLELDFVPDVIVYFCIPWGDKSHYLCHLWGDKELYQNCCDFIKDKLPINESCFVAIQKRTLKFKIFSGVMPNE